MKTDFWREKELNQRLKEELQRCEKEKLRLLQRIKLLSGDKVIEVENADGMKRTFQVTNVNIQRILDQLKSSKDVAQATGELVAKTRELCHEAETEISAMMQELEALKSEKD